MEGGRPVGTSNSSVFKSKDRKDGRTDHYFNGPGDGAKHGHVVESKKSDGSSRYPFARDVEGNVYLSDRQKKR